MKNLALSLIVLFSINTAYAREPIFIVKVHNDYLVLNETKIKSPQYLKKTLVKLESPNEVMLHVHTCLSIERLASVINELVPEYKSRIKVYGTKSDSICRN